MEMNNQYVLPFTESKNGYVSPVSETKNGAVSPAAETKNENVSPVTETKKGAVSPVTEMKKEAALPSRENLLKEIMAAEFTVVDLNLYLDTHPYDQRAVAIYNNSVQRLRMLREYYERLYGPLTAHHSFSSYPWQWINSPWPWEGM